MANKIYAVKKGLMPGIYNSWEECKAQVNGYSGAEYKSFKSSQLSEAISYVGIENVQIESNTEKFIKNKLTNPISTTMIKSNSDKHIDIYVDGSFKNGLYSYGYVAVKNNIVIHTDSGVGKDTGAATMRNVAGELSAAMHAICWAKEKGYTCTIFHDYEGIGKWATKEWKCKNEYTKSYYQFICENKEVVSNFVHVYGHTGNKFNELADKLAGNAFK